MKYTIIEDCSPYYIRFTYDGLDDVIDYCKSVMPTVEKPFTHYVMPDNQARHLLSLVPMTDVMNFMPKRVSLFITNSGKYYRAHKDGKNHRFSINYIVQALDDQCVTSWYSDEDLKGYSIEGMDWASSSRECKDFIKENHTPVKSMTAKPNECILFNTDIFHDFDNSKSTKLRAVLTLRIREPLIGVTYFEDAKRIIFGEGT